MTLLVDRKAAHGAALECEANARDCDAEAPNLTGAAAHLRTLVRALTPQSQGGEAIEVPADLIASDGHPMVTKALVALIECRKERDVLRAEVARMGAEIDFWRRDHQKLIDVTEERNTLRALHEDPRAVEAAKQVFVRSFTYSGEPVHVDGVRDALQAAINAVRGAKP